MANVGRAVAEPQANEEGGRGWLCASILVPDRKDIHATSVSSFVWSAKLLDLLPKGTPWRLQAVCLRKVRTVSDQDLSRGLPSQVLCAMATISPSCFFLREIRVALQEQRAAHLDPPPR